MKQLTILLTLVSLILGLTCPSFSEEAASQAKQKKIKKATQMSKPVVKERTFKIDGEKELPADVSWSSEEELISVNVKNEFDEEIKVKLDTNREYPVGPNEWITLGKRKPGKYTLTIYNKKGEFVDNLSKNIGKENKFVLNKSTISNSDKITTLSTPQKVAITAGAIGAAALGGALLNKALESNDNVAQEQVIPPQIQLPPAQVVGNLPPVAAPVTEEHIEKNNAFAPGGNFFKFLNTKYEQVTLIVEGIDGNSIGTNWIIPKATLLQKPQPLVFNGEKISINPDQKVKVVIPEGFELVRYAFELETDSFDGGYVWVLK